MRRLSVMLAGLLFLTSAVATAQPPGTPEVTGVTKVAQGKLVRLKVKLEPGESAQWMAFPLNAADFESEPDGRFRMTGAPGTYDLIVDVYGVKKVGDTFAAVSRRAVLQVEITGKSTPKPAPTPNPTPVPPPSPKPAPGPTPENVGLFLIVVEDGVTRTTDTARVLADKTYWGRVQERGHAYEFYKLNSPEVAVKGYKLAMDKLGVQAPALIVASPIPGTDQATFRTCVKLPKNTTGDTDSIDATIKKYSTK